MVSQKLYAFWNYDNAPGLLGAEIVRFNNDGTVEPKGYRGAKVMPIIVLPDERGRQALDALETLRIHYYQDEKNMVEEYRQMALSVVKEGATVTALAEE